MQSVARETIRLKSRIARSYRVDRTLGALDIPLDDVLKTTIEYDAPPTVEEPWRVGLILGPSGSGKTAIARKHYGAGLYPGFDWSAERAIVDQFDARSFDELVAACASVGLGSLPSLARPYATLSGGERFRCDVVKALLDFGAERDVVAIDEFTSLLDRNAARAGAIALRNAFDRNVFGKTRLVAITCHADVETWLEPDWTLDMTTGRLRRGRLRRPELQFRLYEGGRRFWPLFRRDHYLNGALNRASRVFIATSREDGRERPVAFIAIMQLEGWRGVKRVHRLVVRPEYQGIGLGGALLSAIAQRVAREGATLRIISGNLFFLRKLARSKNWRLVASYPHGKTQRRKGRPEPGSFGRALASFEWRGAMDCQ